MASKKKTAYTRAFGGGTDNLWETVDTIMVDLMTQQVNGDTGIQEEVDVEKRKSNSKKDAELNELMENLDHVLDDLRDISSISNDTATPPKPINTSAEKIRPRRATNKEFLGKENPFDPITQGLLYQTADVPLFASSDQLAGIDEDVDEGAESDASGFSEAADDAWDEDDYEASSKGDEQAKANSYNSRMPENGNNSTHSEASRPYGTTNKTGETRKNIKDRISIFQELSKSTGPVVEVKHKDRPSSVHHHIISPTASFRSRPFSSAASIVSQRPSSSSRTDLSSSSSPSSSSPLSSSLTPPAPSSPVSSRALPRPPRSISIPSSPKGSPQVSPTTTSPKASTSPSTSSSLSNPIPSSLSSTTPSSLSNATPPSQSYRPPVPPRSSPKTAKRPNIPSSAPTPVPAPVPRQFMPPSNNASTFAPSSVPSELFLDHPSQAMSSSAPARGRLNTRLNIILTTELPPLPETSILDKPKKHKKTLDSQHRGSSFHPSIRTSDSAARSQINIGVTRAIRISAESNGSTSTSPSSNLSVSTSPTSLVETPSTSPDSSSLTVASNSHVASPPIPIPGTSDSDSSNSPSPSSQSYLETPPETSEADQQNAEAASDSTSPSTNSTNGPTVAQLREASMRRVLSSPHLRGQKSPSRNPPVQRVSSQNTLLKQKRAVPPSTSPPAALSSSAENIPPSSSPPPSHFHQSHSGIKPKSLRLTPVGQHRTTTSRLIFGGDGLSVHMPAAPPSSAPSVPPRPAISSGNSVSQNGTTPPPETCINNTPNTPNESEGITRRAPTTEVKERNAKIKQLRDLTRRYRAKLGQLETKYSRENQELQTQFSIAVKEASMHIKICTTWGYHVLTQACRASWQMKVIVLQHRLEMRTTQTALLQAKIDIVDQLMQLLEIEYRQGSDASAKNDFVIYSSFFKDPTEVSTNADIEHITRVLPALMREKHRAKLELNRAKVTYQPEQLDRRSRRVKDILVRLLPSPLVPNYFLVDDLLQADFDSLVTDQRLLEGRHIQHLKNFLQDDLAGERSITPNEVTDFLEQFAYKMAETFGVNQQDLGKLLLLCKRAIYPRIYPLLAIPASVHEEDKKLGEQMTWLNKLDPAVLREGLKLDKRPFQNANSVAAFEPAIDALNELAFLTVPTEMAVAVHKCFKLTHDITHAQVKSAGGPAHSEMGLDDVFPVFLWVVTQCNVAQLCKCVYFMEFFSDSDEKISALGYSATSLAAAVAHLGMVEKESFLPPVVP